MKQKVIWLIQTCIICLTIIFYFQTKVHANGAYLYAFKDEYMSCGAWIKNSSDPEALMQYDTWIRGFISGTNFKSRKSQKMIPDNESMNLFITNYCNKNPLDGWLAAVINLNKDLHK